MMIKKISITFLAIIFATSSFGQVKSIDERIGEAMNGSNWAELRSLYMSDGKNLQTPFLKPLSKFFISQFYNEPDSAIKYGKEILEKYQEELNSSVPSIMYFLAEDYATLGHYDKASALFEAYRKGGQVENPVIQWGDITCIFHIFRTFVKELRPYSMEQSANDIQGISFEQIVEESRKTCCAKRIECNSFPISTTVLSLLSTN